MPLQNDEIRNQLQAKLQVLNLSTTNESAYSKLECLFYDVLALARLLDENEQSKSLLFLLQKIKREEFQLSLQVYQKAKQREVFIKKFKNAFKIVLSQHLKNGNVGSLSS